MIKFKTLIYSSLIMALTLAPADSYAGDSYWGIGFGKSSFNIKPLYGSNEVDDSGAFKVVIGSRFGNLGYEMDFSFASYDWKGLSSATHNASNVVFAGLGYLPISDSFDIYGKLGLNLWGTTVDYSGTLYDGDNGVGVAYGAGMDIQVTDKMTIRAEYQAMNGIGDGIDEGDISNVTVSLLFDF